VNSCTPEEILNRCREGLPDFTGHDSVACSDGARVALVASLRNQTSGRVWLVTDSIREQEALHGELAEWVPETRLLPILPDADAAILEDPETVAERLEALTAGLSHEHQDPLVICAQQLEEEVPDPEALKKQQISLQTGQDFDPYDLTAKLVEMGYERCPLVSSRGQLAQRGGILDIHSFHASRPVRIEFDDQTVTSIRTFEVDSQTAIEEIDSTHILFAGQGDGFVRLRTLIDKRDLVVDLSGSSIESVKISPEGVESGFLDLEFDHLATGELVMDASRSEQFVKKLREWQKDGWAVHLAAGTEPEAARFLEFLREREIETDEILHLPRPLSFSFVHAPTRTVVLAEAALLGRAANVRAARMAKRRFHAASQRGESDFSSFEIGDLVVHLEEGIGVFEGFEAMEGGEESLVIRYANEAKLYVPLAGAWQVGRYAGVGKSNPKLSELGSDRWAKAKSKTVRSVFDYAAKMLTVQAERDTLAGEACTPDTHWQEEFEGSFPFKETTDQLKAIREAKKDMESIRPMDRLICGDVGFGKTEVAIRAAFKTVMSNRQAAILAPTTVLTQQHGETLRARMSDYPLRVEVLNRYVPATKQRAILKGLADGSVDIIVGTHRLLSKDVSFQNLGLVVVDEEQRFGVKHKDTLKERFRQVDLLTLSATPIPRTLYMALVGTRDMSLLETPPANRQPVETVVCAYDERTFRDAIKHELKRGGQIYFLHNRVKTIKKIAERIQHLVPEARIVVGHGQMPEGELDQVMRTFVSGKADVLVSTTIIESGLDIPNANTIIIDRADLFGLADLYQLRGRVGRAGAKAFAYLMLPRDLMGAARKRVSAIRQYTDLGSGFRIAMRDLELRGAGNLLGTAQSGHIMTVGFDLYCKMLRRAVDTLQGKTRFTRADCPVRLDFVDTSNATPEEQGRVHATIPISYVEDASLRIRCYKQVAEAESPEQVNRIEQEWRDRFGRLPESASNLLTIARIGTAGIAARLSSVETVADKIRCRRGENYLQRDGRFPRLTSQEPTSKLLEVLHFVESLSAS